MSVQKNPFLDAIPDLGELTEVIWRELEQSSAQPDAPWGLGSFATVTQESDATCPAPSVRMLVLRRADPESRYLIWHTDRRSTKIHELTRNGQSSVLFWSPELRVQLVIRGITDVYEAGELFDAEWNGSQLTSRRAYLGDSAPGTEADSMCVNFPEIFQSRPPTKAESEPGRKHFAVLLTKVSMMDLLILQKSGNVRANFVWSEAEDSWNSFWVCP